MTEILTEQEQSYLNNRLKNQQSYFSQKAAKNKKRYFLNKITTIIATALVPVILLLGGLFENEAIVKFIAAGLGALATITTSLNSLCQYHEGWLKYRHISEQLKYHRYKFSYGAAPYSDSHTRLSQLVDKVEELVLDESYQWLDRNKEDKPQAPRKTKAGAKSGESANNLEVNTNSEA